ncbi:MAG TPA: hypothetical protein VGF65_11345 [Mycobacterium sp.]|jgi:hypothetical protein
MAAVNRVTRKKAAKQPLDEVAKAPMAIVKVGFLGGATYPDGTSVAMVAAVNEFGAPSRGQPPRPFFRNMIADQSPTWGAKAAAILKTNGGDVKATLDVLGQEIQGRLIQSINTLTEPPLAASTIARKGFDKPLIDTSLMVKSVSYEVTER